MPKLHYLQPTRETMIGCITAERPSVLTITSGDTVCYKLLDAGWGLEPLVTFEPQRLKFEPRTEDDGGHCLIGPVIIEGAQPGMTLEIQIGALRPGNYGFTTSSGWDHIVNRRLGLLESQGIIHAWKLDADTMTGVNQHQQRVQLRPFLGVMGMPPEAQGKHSTIPPRFCGGNLDCKELTAGTRLYLPIPVEGAYFYAGDGHAAQGDGEVSVTAIECPIDEVHLTFHVREDMPITQPRAWTPEGWLTFGLHEDLEEAMYLALDDMLALICKQYHISKPDALALASVTVDLRITQIVNGVRGVHAFLPHHAIATGG
jgi:acetamidase/formamidase